MMSISVAAAAAHAGHALAEREWPQQQADALQDVCVVLMLSPPPRDVVEDAARLRMWVTGAVRRRVLERRRRQVPLIDELAARFDHPDRAEVAGRVHALLA